MGETESTRSAARSPTCAAVGVDIVTLGQYLQPDGRSTCPSRAGGRPTSSTALRADGEALGFAHVESGPLVRSSYHARAGIDQHGRRSLLTNWLRGRALLIDLLRSRRMVGGAAAVLRGDRAERRRRPRERRRPRASTRCASSAPHRVAYLDLTGSGVETIAHLRDNGRITLMACAFDGRAADLAASTAAARCTRSAPTASTQLAPSSPTFPARGRSSTSTSTASPPRAATRCR